MAQSTDRRGRFVTDALIFDTLLNQLKITISSANTLSLIARVLRFFDGTKKVGSLASLARPPRARCGDSDEAVR